MTKTCCRGRAGRRSSFRRKSRRAPRPSPPACDGCRRPRARHARPQTPAVPGAPGAAGPGYRRAPAGLICWSRRSGPGERERARSRLGRLREGWDLGKSQASGQTSVWCAAMTKDSVWDLMGQEITENNQCGYLIHIHIHVPFTFTCTCTCTFT